MPRYNHTILEIGCGRTPFIAEAVGERRLLKGNRYIGIDLFPDHSDRDIRQLVRAVQYANRQGKVELRRGTGLVLPFDVGEIDEVVYANVLGDIRTQERAALIAEGARVLNPILGQLAVVETLSPWPLEATRELAEAAGLVQTNAGREQTVRAIEPFAWPPADIRMERPEARAYAAFFIHGAPADS